MPLEPQTRGPFVVLTMLPLPLLLLLLPAVVLPAVVLVRAGVDSRVPAAGVLVASVPAELPTVPEPVPALLPPEGALLVLPPLAPVLPLAGVQ